jgi:hypothetical protein
MALTIQQIREKLKSQQDKKTNFTTDNAIYPFWNMAEGSTATVRFLPDGDLTNDFFWRERQVIDLPFPGIKGQASKPVTVTIPCMDMWDETDFILNEIKPWWKDESPNSDLPYGATNLKELARKYWKKKSYLFQGFVVTNPLEEEAPDNPIRRFIINPSIFEKIRASIMDADMEDLPTDYVNGTDFKIKLTKKGGYSNYDSSEWSRKSRSLTETELTAIDENKLYALKEFLPKKPTGEELEVISEMFRASVEGEEFDMDEFGKFYKPRGSYGNTTASGSSSSSSDEEYTPRSTSTSSAPKASNEGAQDALAKLKEKMRSKDEDEVGGDDETVTVSSPATGKKLDASELLELIRNRSKKTSE